MIPNQRSISSFVVLSSCNYTKSVMYTKVILALILFATVMVSVEASDEAELKELVQNHMDELNEEDLANDPSLQEVIEEYRSEIAVIYRYKETRYVIKATISH